LRLHFFSDWSASMLSFTSKVQSPKPEKLVMRLQGRWQRFGAGDVQFLLWVAVSLLIEISNADMHLWRCRGCRDPVFLAPKASVEHVIEGLLPV
jgi:hypothetical protein